MARTDWMTAGELGDELAAAVRLATGSAWPSGASRAIGAEHVRLELDVVSNRKSGSEARFALANSSEPPTARAVLTWAPDTPWSLELTRLPVPEGA